MALRRDTAIATIQPLDSDPEYARLAGIRRTLLAAKRTREAGIDILAIEGELARPTGNSRGPRGDMLRARLASLRSEAAPPPEKQTPTPPDGLPANVELALKVAQGEAVTPEPDRNARLDSLACVPRWKSPKPR